MTQLLDTLAETGFSEGRRQWPKLRLTAHSFGEYLARLPVERLAELQGQPRRLAELYLVSACLAEHAPGILALREYCQPAVTAALEKLELAESVAKEVSDELFGLLLTRDEQRQPRLAQFAAFGPLRSWVRVAAVRLALNTKRARRRETPLDPRTLCSLTQPEDAEQKLLVAHSVEEFKPAFAAAFARMSSRERNLLRNQLVDGLTSREIGVLYRVHHATAARWLERIRQKLAKETRRELASRLRSSADEIDSMLKLVMADCDSSLRHLLKESVVLKPGQTTEGKTT